MQVAQAVVIVGVFAFVIQGIDYGQHWLSVWGDRLTFRWLQSRMHEARFKLFCRHLDEPNDIPFTFSSQEEHIMTTMALIQTVLVCGMLLVLASGVLTICHLYM